MHLFSHYYESTPLFFAQAALTIWMLVDASRRRVEFYWYWLILFLQPIGAWAYFVMFKQQLAFFFFFCLCIIYSLNYRIAKFNCGSAATKKAIRTIMIGLLKRSYLEHSQITRSLNCNISEIL